MRRIVIILGGVALVILAFIVYEARQSDYSNTKATWYGGLPGDNRRIENRTLDQISGLAAELAAIYAEPVQFKSASGRVVYQAYAEGYDKSNCLKINEKAWQRGKLIISEVKKVCGLLLDDRLWGGFPGDLPVVGYPRVF